MVSFFGLKFGDKKKKSDGKAALQKQPQQWKRIDQNALGEGQFFGQNIHQKGVINGSIRSVSRAGTPQPGASGRSPYAHYDTHNLAAVSMYDLSHPARRGSQTSLQLKPHASDINLRTRLGAHNGSSTSLALPTPGFGARFGANNASSTSLAAPMPGFGSRPGTPNRSKPWVNPLDVHFARSSPSGPPTPKSPLAASMQLPPTPTTDTAENGSVFGEDADDMVDAVMAAVKRQEQEAREAKERERELEKQRETARLEMERLERQKSTESNLSAKPPSVTQPPPDPRKKPAEAPNLQAPALRGDIDIRPGSRNGPIRVPSLHQGPPPTGPPTQCLPQLPSHGPSRQGPLGPAGESSSARGPRPAGLTTNGPGPGARLNSPGSHASNPFGASSSIHPQSAHPLVANSEGPPQKVYRPYRPPPLQSSGPLGPLPDGLRSPSPPLRSPVVDNHRSDYAAIRSPPSNERRLSVADSEAPAPARSERDTPEAERRGLEQLITGLTSPSTVTSPSGSTGRPSLDGGPVEQSARPIIQNVSAKRDTLTLNTPRQHSLSMKIEELEKTLLSAQQAHRSQTNQDQHISRASASSSVYSGGINREEEDDDDDGPILPVQPAPLRIPPPAAPPAASIAASDRPQSPFRGPTRRGPLPRRPGLEEYGVPGAQVSKSRGGTPTPASRSGSTDNYSSHSSPPSRTNTPQLRHPNWRRDLNPSSPAPTVDTFDRPRPSPVVDTGFNFDFGFGPSPGVAAPPTPDSTNWPLASPTSETGSVPPPTSEPPPRSARAEQPPAKFTRANVPPPLNLKFNFSPDAPSRDPSLGRNAGLWTPPLRSTPGAASTADGRPSTSAGPGSGRKGGGGLAASPRLISQFPEPSVPRDDSRPAEDDLAAFMGIGVARGPSIREVRRPGTAGGGRGPPMSPLVDSFGTGFI